MDRPPLLDAAHRPITELAIVEVCYRGTWRRGRVLHLYRRWVLVELWILRTHRLRESRRRPEQVYVVRG